MQLMLEPKEQEILGWALKATLSELGDEISHTERHEFREDLKDRKAILQGILNRLG